MEKILEEINGGGLFTGVTIYGLIKAGCWIAGAVFAAGAVSGAAEAISNR